jgi:hypothetical protein
MESLDNKPKRIDAKKAAQGYYRQGKSFKQALIDAGASEPQASKGKGLLMERDGLRKAFAAEHKNQLKKLELMGAYLSPEEQENVVRGALVEAVLTEKAAPKVRAAELLGKDKRVAMWTPDTAIGIFNMAIPSGWESRYLTTEPASAEDDPKVLPKFSPVALPNGRVEISATIPVTEPEPIPVIVPSPTPNHSEDDYETS